MAYKVFISSSLKDMQAVNELKGSLTRYGIESILPSEPDIVPPSPWFAKSPPIPFPVSQTDLVKKQIQDSDCVLVVIGRDGSRSESVDFEIGVAMGSGRLIIPLIEEGANIPRTLSDKQYILIDRNQPRLSYERAAQYLNQLKIEKEKRNAAAGLLLLGLGLFLLAALASSD